VLTHNDLLKRLAVLYPCLPSLEQLRSLHSHAPASRKLYQRFSKVDLHSLIGSYPSERAHLLEIPSEKESSLVNYAVSMSDELAEKIRLPRAVPPEDIHRMQKGDIYWRGDLYSANMLLAALELAGQSPCMDHVFLDFGCSSGSLLRVLKAVFPDSTCIGTDPVESSIEWAAENLPAITFHVSPLVPPIDVPTGSIDVISAISIWSHFSPTAAVIWLKEMHRLLAPGGVFVFTIHGIYTLFWHCRNRNREPSYVDEIYRSMCEYGFYFQSLAIEPSLPQSPDWGSMYMTIEWLQHQCRSDWDILLYQPGRSQFNQDLLVMRSK
jgi:SAM-dependent methyltransferase